MLYIRGVSERIQVRNALRRLMLSSEVVLKFFLRISKLNKNTLFKKQL